MADDFKYHIDHHGSLVRPPALLAARAAGLSGEALAATEEDAVEAAAHLQRRLVLSTVGDGQFRREHFESVVYDHVSGFAPVFGPTPLAELAGIPFARRRAIPGGLAGPGGPGGLAGNTQVSSALVKLLEQDAGSYKWVAATEGSEGAAPIELATGDAVMAIGGFNGTDPWPTLAVFEELVANHEIHYYVGQGSESFGGGRGSSTIASWVAAHFKKETVGGQTVYDLTQPLSGTA